MARKILIVEDNLNIAENISDFLEMSGYDPCSIATNYDDAVSRFNDLNPDLTLLDINLEGDLTGIDVAEFIRAHSASPFIYCSASVEPGLLEMAKATNPFAFIAKPMQFAHLKATIDAAFNADRDSDESYMKILSGIAFLIAPAMVV